MTCVDSGSRVSAGERPPALLDLVRLNLSCQAGQRLYGRLVAAFGSVGAALAASEAALGQVAGIKPETAAALRAVRREDAEVELERALRLGVELVPFGDGRYPARLALVYDPPLLLYVRGALGPPDAPAVAIVGARRATHYGRRQAERFGRGIAAAGVAVVSGLARGIDAAAHRGALAAGGRTLAVLGSGLANLYPRENAGLAAEIVERGGAVMSELPLAAPALPHHFPRRNRIVSGLCLGVVVVEAAERSGSLITVTWALEQGRDVFGIPGRADDEMSRGVHKLLRDGAGLVTGPDEVLAGLGLAVPEAVAADGAGSGGAGGATDLSPHETAVLAGLGPDPRPLGDLLDEMDLPASTVLATLTLLEVRRLAVQYAGKLFARAPPGMYVDGSSTSETPEVGRRSQAMPSARELDEGDEAVEEACAAREEGERRRRPAGDAGGVVLADGGAHVGRDDGEVDEREERPREAHDGALPGRAAPPADGSEGGPSSSLSGRSPAARS